jgi:phosphoenolpyruvate carboxylase
MNMKFAIKILERKKEEYETLLDIITNRLNAGNKVLRNQSEVNTAKKAKAHYEECLAELDAAIKLLGDDGMSYRPVSNADKLAEIRKDVESGEIHGSRVHDQMRFLLSELDRFQTRQRERDKLIEAAISDIRTPMAYKRLCQTLKEIGAGEDKL